MSPWITSAPAAGSEIGPFTMMYHGKPTSLDSEIGALTVLHGSLQSAIADVDDATNAESAFYSALSGLAHDG